MDIWISLLLQDLILTSHKRKGSCLQLFYYFIFYSECIQLLIRMKSSRISVLMKHKTSKTILILHRIKGHPLMTTSHRMTPVVPIQPRMIGSASKINMTISTDWDKSFWHSSGNNASTRPLIIHLVKDMVRKYARAGHILRAATICNIIDNARPSGIFPPCFISVAS